MSSSSLFSFFFFWLTCFGHPFLLGRSNLFSQKAIFFDEKRIHTALCDSNEAHEERSYYIIIRSLVLSFRLNKMCACMYLWLLLLILERQDTCRDRERENMRARMRNKLNRQFEHSNVWVCHARLRIGFSLWTSLCNGSNIEELWLRCWKCY